MRDTTVIFVRHGSVHNPKRIIYGRLPWMRLSPEGREQMDRTARYLAQVPLAGVYTSPLLRAVESARCISQYHPGVPLRRCIHLLEVRTSWQGHPNKAVEDLERFSYYDPPKGEGDETVLEVFARMNRALQMVLRRHPGRTTVCVSHGDPIKILRIGYSGRALTAEQARAPDPGQGAMLTFHFWHPDALPIIGVVDLARMERIISGVGGWGSGARAETAADPRPLTPSP